MKKIVFLLILVNASLIIGVGFGYYLAEKCPFQVDSPLFGLQSFAEEARILLSQEPVHRVHIRFDLVDRRLSDLAKMEDGSNIDPALQAFELALTKAAAGLEELPGVKQLELYQDIEFQLARIDLVFSRFEMGSNPDYLPGIQAKISGLRQTANQARQEPAAPPAEDGRLSIGKLIPFLSRSHDHEAFVIDGKHEDAACLDCHKNGVYATTPTACAACHPINDQVAREELPFAFQMLNPLYPDHFAGNCDSCHSTSGWNPVTFDHIGVWECSSCHIEDLPSIAAIQTLTSPFADRTIQPRGASQTLFASLDLVDFLAEPPVKHYAGDCRLCHTDTTDWSIYAYTHEIAQADFDMFGLTTEETGLRPVRVVQNCAICHTVDEKSQAPGHQTIYDSNCTICHLDSEIWEETTFDHNDYTDCAECHPLDDSAWHFPGECSGCHTDRAWNESIYQHDTRTACHLCHIAPGSHYPGTCAGCHTPLDWYLSIYKHNLKSDCTTCHTAPDEHQVGQCSTCHSPESWQDNAIYHALQTCSLCHTQPTSHYPGDCTLCHQTQDWIVSEVNHGELTECTACHTLDDTLGTHYSGLCSKCHTTKDWLEVIFNHEGFNLCADCHAPPIDHFDGECAGCHISTDDWLDNNYDHSNLNECKDCHVSPEEHYPGTCSQCHSTLSWEFIGYNHSIVDKCTGCHTAPTTHWPGQCSNCHGITTWEIYTFDHTVYTDCKSCHLRPAGHPRGQCSNCHVPESWTIIITKTTTSSTTPNPSETPTPTDVTPEPSETPPDSTPEPSENPTEASPEPSETETMQP